MASLLNKHGMNDRIRSVTNDLDDAANDVRTSFGHLGPAQINWRSGEKVWSVAQCLDHLIITHSKYVPMFEKLAAGDAEPTLWERVSPLSGYFGRFLIRSLDPANQKKTKTSAKAMPSSSGIGIDIVDHFVEHQRQLIDAIKKLPDAIDTKRAIITSPLLSLVTYSLDDTFTILVVHCRRHINQAKRVTESAGFPKD